MFEYLIVNTTGVAPHWLSDGGGGGGVPPTHRNKKNLEKKNYKIVSYPVSYMHK